MWLTKLHRLGHKGEVVGLPLELVVNVLVLVLDVSVDGPLVLADPRTWLGGLFNFF